MKGKRKKEEKEVKEKRKKEGKEQGKNEKIEKKKKSEEIQELKEKYEKLRKKYGLPEFEELNKEFEIERVDPNTEMLLRSIRRTIFDKFLNFANFLENILTNPRPFTMFILKKISEKDKKECLEIIETVAKITTELALVELDYKEEKEAEAIKKLYEEWKKMKEKMLVLVEKIDKELKSSKEKPKYFG